MRDLGSLPGGHDDAEAAAINNHGQVVGTSGLSGYFGAPRAFLWTAATGMRPLAASLPPGLSFFFPSAINEQTQVAGTGFFTASGASHATLWSAGSGFRDLGTLPGLPTSGASDVSDRTQVVGSSSSADGSQSRAFVWAQAAGMRELPPLPGAAGASASAINNRGQVVGSSQLAGGASRATLWALPRTAAEQLQDLAGQVTALAASGALRRVDARPLLAKLAAARKSLDSRGQPTRATRKILGAFVHQVRAFIRTGRLPAAAGRALISAARCV